MRLPRLIAALAAALLLTQPALAAEGSTIPLLDAGLASPGGAAPILLSSINVTFPATTTDSGCWSGQWATGTPALNNPDGGSPTTVTITRGGYDTSAAAHNYSVNLVLTQRVNQNVPNYATPTASTVAFSNYVYPTDTVPGGSTASCDAAPAPLANWPTPERLTFGNTISGVEVAAFSRDANGGSEVAAVVCTASDGTHSVSGTVSAMTVSARSDPNPVVIYLCPSLNISTLNAGSFTYDAAVYPWYGGSGSINNSANNSGAAAFSTRRFWHDTGNPLVAYLCPQSNGSCTGTASTSCTASTTAATAAASPCSTGEAASNAMKAAGNVDNAIIYVGTNAGTPPVASNTTSGGLTQAGGCLTFTRDPAVSKVNAQIGFASGSFDPPNVQTVTNVTTGCVRFTDLSVKRTGNFLASGPSLVRLGMIFDGVNLDNNSAAANWLNRSDDYFYNVTATNWVNGIVAGGAGGEHRIFRGVTITDPGNLGTFTVLGSTFANWNTANLSVLPGGTQDGQIFAFNKFFSVTGNLLGVADSIVKGLAYVQNVAEYISSTSNYLLGIANDNNLNSDTNVILQYDTFAGAFAGGRANIFYDQGGNPRTSKLQDCRGMAWVSAATKGQLFMNDATRAGQTGYEYGVGCQGQVTASIDGSSGGIGSSTGPVYPGLSGNFSASNTPAANPFNFTTNGGVTYSGGTSGTYTTGAGNGNYQPTSGSPLKGVVLAAALPFDLAGNARPATADSAGAYVAP